MKKLKAATGKRSPLKGRAKQKASEFIPIRYKWTDGFRSTAFYTPDGWCVLFFGMVYGPFPKDDAKKLAMRMAIESATG